MKIPQVLIELGKAIQVTFSDGFQKKFGINYYLTTSKTGKSLYIFKYKKMRTSFSTKKSPSGENLYLKWSDFEPENFQIKIDTNIKMHRFGTLNAIVYDSNKWTNKWNLYKHIFEYKPEIYRDEKSSIYCIKNGRFSVTELGIEG